MNTERKKAEPYSRQYRQKTNGNNAYNVYGSVWFEQRIVKQKTKLSYDGKIRRAARRGF